LEEPAEPETEAARDETPVSQPEAEATKSAEEVPQPEAVAPAAAEAESEAGCPVKMGWFSGPICSRKLHAAPGEVDEQPVCLMHSKDPNKQSDPLFDTFWQEFEKILEEAGEKEAHFEHFVFPGADFRNRNLKAICRFNQATFSQNANFNDAIFTQIVDFGGAIFEQGASFWEVNFMQDANFSGATFKHDAYFINAIFTQKANFNITTFTQEATFKHVIFEQKAMFFKATFTQNANFSIASFKQDAIFSQTTFTLKADFSVTTFKRNANFERTEFHETVDWSRSRFLDQAEFRHTKFLSIESKVPSAVFSLADFSQPGEVVFENVDFSRTLFHNCDVSEVCFNSSVHWTERKGHRGLAVFEEEILLDPEFTYLQKLYGSIDHGAVEQIYHQLQKNYDSRLDYRKANDFHYGEMEMKRLAVPVSRWPRWPRRWQHRKWNFVALYRWASDYGNSYRKPLWWLLGIVLGTALLFPITGLEWKQPKPGNAVTNTIVTYGEVWNQQDTWTNNLWTVGKLIGKSGITAVDTATFQRNPEYTPVYPWGRILGILETLLTSSLFALFLLAIRRQFRR
ncbi:MAG TPA: pentapeptide repeat-containing protein, partial [Terracidiphilus sp.]